MRDSTSTNCGYDIPAAERFVAAAFLSDEGPPCQTDWEHVSGGVVSTVKQHPKHCPLLPFCSCRFVPQNYEDVVVVGKGQPHICGDKTNILVACPVTILEFSWG